MADRRVKLILEAATDQFDRAMAGAARSAEDVKSSAQDIGREWSRASRTMQSDMRTVGTGFAAVGGAILGVYGNLVSTGIEYNTLQQVAGRSLETVMGSASAAADQMERLHEFADTSPFARQTWIEAQMQLSAFGMEAERIVPTLDAVQNAVAAIGGGDAEIMRIVDILGAVEGQGRFTGRELQRLGQMGIDAAEMIGSAMGVSGDEIRTQITAGSLDAETAITALTEGMMMRFDGAAEGMRETMTGAWDRLKAAWRDLGSILATPLVDPEGGGGLVWLTNAAADAIRVLEGIPDPVLQTVGAMSGLAGVAMAGYGAMMLLVPQIVAFRDAKARLATEMPKTTSAMGGFSRAAGVAAGAFVGLQVASAAVDWFREGGRSASAFERELNILAESGGHATNALNEMSIGTANLGTHTEDLADMGTAIRELTPSWYNLGGAIGWLSPTVRNAKDEWAGLDQGLANMVSGGNVEQSIQQMSELAESALNQGRSLEEVADFMPHYIEALNSLVNQHGLAVTESELLAWAFEGIEPEAVKAAGGIDGVKEAAEEEARAAEEAEQANAELEEALADLGVTAEGTVESLERFMDVLFEAGLLTQSVMEAEAAFEAQLDAVDESVKRLTESLTEDYIAKGYSEQAARDLAKEQVELGYTLNDTKDAFDITTDAGREAQDQFFGVADSGRDMARAMAENDASQSEVQGALQRTYDSLVTTAQGFGMTRDDAEALTNEVLRIPDDASVESWMSDEAKRVAEETRESILSVDGLSTSSSHTHTVTENNVINTVRNFTERLFKADGGAVGFSTGGSVRGPGGPRDDLIPANLSNGEHVLTARDVQAMGGQDAVYSFRRDLHNGPSASSMVSAYQPGQARQAQQIATAVSGGSQEMTGTLYMENGALLGQVRMAMKDSSVAQATSQALQSDARRKAKVG